MRKCYLVLILFWTMWSATTVSKNKEGGLTFTGGVYIAPGDEAVYNDGAKPGDVLWHRAGAYYDTKKDCEQGVKKFDADQQWLVCLPNGIRPRQSGVTPPRERKTDVKNSKRDQVIY